MANDATEQSQRPGMAIVHEIGVLTGEVAGLVCPGPGDGEDPRAGGDADDESGGSWPAVSSAGWPPRSVRPPDEKEQFGDDGAEKEATGQRPDRPGSIAR